MNSNYVRILFNKGFLGLPCFLLIRQDKTENRAFLFPPDRRKFLILPELVK